MADADRIAAALRYQQELDAAQRPATMNPNLAAQGQAYRANMTAPTSVMDPRYPAWKQNQDAADAVGAVGELALSAIPLAGPALQGAKAAGRFAAPVAGQALENYMVRSGGILPMVSSPLGRIPETGVDTRKLADMLERAGVKSGYEIARESSAISPSQYITFRNPLDESATRQIRISNHADKYPELASGVRQSVDPTTEISFEQAVNWLAKEGYPTSLSNKYKNVPSWEQYYSEQQSARDANRLQILRDAWLNKPKASRGPRPTESDLTVNK